MNDVLLCTTFRARYAFISDTRTNAGVDHISVFRKLYTFGIPGERMIVIQASGNLATTQAVIGHIKISSN